LYDWGRTDAEGKPRPLHLQEGLEAINCELPLPVSFKHSREEGLLFDDEHFTISWRRVQGTRQIQAGSSFSIWTVVEGNGLVAAGGQEAPLVQGSSILLPAGIGETTATGEFSFLLTLPSIRSIN
jgi:mannose-6-phosphate isomerase